MSCYSYYRITKICFFVLLMVICFLLLILIIILYCNLCRRRCRLIVYTCVIIIVPIITLTVLFEFRRLIIHVIALAIPMRTIIIIILIVIHNNIYKYNSVSCFFVIPCLALRVIRIMCLLHCFLILPFICFILNPLLS